MVLVWEPITDLPQEWDSLTDGELGPLLQFWNDQRADLEQSGALAEFNKRLGREWSIETGQIEGVYDLDRGITQTLIERGIDADLIGNHPGQKPPEIIAAIIQDHADVLEGLFQFGKGDRPLSKGYIHELHAALVRHQDTTAVRDQFGNLFESHLIKGKYKDRPNNPQKPDGSMHQYCPPEQVDTEMERLLSQHAEHEKKGVPVEIEAAWLHHRFTQIHPYQDGNGRVARALASLLFIKEGWFPVGITRDDRANYITALETADEGALDHLIAFFIDLQKRTLIEATQTAADLQKIETIEDAIGAAKLVLTAPGRNLDPNVWLGAQKIADKLIILAARRLDSIAHALTVEIGPIRPELQFTRGTSYDLIPPNLPYKPNRLEYERIAPLRIINASRYSSIEVQAHAVGSRFRGLIGLVVVFGRTNDAVVASKDFFQVNYAESPESAERRFRPWLEESLVNALTLWRKSL
jgi:Fic family protein